MNTKLSKEDLEARALNLNIHNHCLFLFASMLKRCNMGNYYKQRNPFTFRESTGQEIPICDALYYDEYEQVLVIEVKTRLVKDSQVNVKDSVKSAILKELKSELFNNYFIVPVFMYTAINRDGWNFRDAQVMMYYGDSNTKVWTEPRALASYYEDIKDSGSIHDLFNNLDRPRCVKLEIIPPTPQLETIQERDNKPPIISRRLKSKYFYIRYDQKPLRGWQHLHDIMIDSGFYDNSKRATSNILRSLAGAVGTGAMSLVIEWQGDMFDLDKSTLEATLYKSSIRYGFKPSFLEMLKESDLLIIFMNEKYIPNEEDFKRFTKHMDSISGNIK